MRKLYTLFVHLHYYTDVDKMPIIEVRFNPHTNRYSIFYQERCDEHLLDWMIRDGYSFKGVWKQDEEFTWGCSKPLTTRFKWRAKRWVKRIQYTREIHNNPIDTIDHYTITTN